MPVENIGIGGDESCVQLGVNAHVFGSNLCDNLETAVRVKLACRVKGQYPKGQSIFGIIC